MTQHAASPVPPGEVVRWEPPACASADHDECRKIWRDNVVRRQDFEVAHPDVIWPPRDAAGARWVTYVPMPDGTFLEVVHPSELGKLLDKLEIAIAYRDAQSRRAG